MSKTSCCDVQQIREILLKFCGNRAFPQNFHTRKLGEIIALNAVLLIFKFIFTWHFSFEVSLLWLIHLPSLHFSQCLVNFMFIEAFGRSRQWSEPIQHKKWSFPLRFSSENVSKSAVSYGFGHIYWGQLLWKTFLCSAKYWKNKPGAGNWESFSIGFCVSLIC